LLQQLWLLPSGPDQVGYFAMRGDPPAAILTDLATKIGNIYPLTILPSYMFYGGIPVGIYRLLGL
jgi:hypothetical protein